MKHKHKWHKNPDYGGYSCECGAWTCDKKVICEFTEPKISYC